MDRRALPEPGPVTTDGYVAPRTDPERVLAQVWGDVLKVERVGVADDFFSLGGDSILSIQVVSRARLRGLELSPRDLFTHPTVAALAAHASPVPHRTVSAEQGPVTGPVPLTPVQHWYFEQGGVGDDFTQCVHMELAYRPDVAALRAAVAALLTQHDALRARFSRTADGWRQRYAPVGSDDPLQVVRLPDGADGDELARRTVAAAHAGLDLADGPVLRAVLFDRAGQPPELFLTAHHLVVDGVSWRILLADLERGYAQAAAGKPVDLGPKSTSYAQWARQLGEHAASGALDAELDHWTAVEAATPAPLPVDGDAANTYGAERAVTVELDRDTTDALLRRVPGAYRTQVNDVLLAALGRVLAGWTGGSGLLLDLEGHGREELPDVDLSRTVGWFTSIFPVALDIPAGDWGELLKSVKEQLRAVPGRGLGYGALRYLRDGSGLGARPAPAVSFNHLGRLDAPGGTDAATGSTALVGPAGSAAAAGDGALVAGLRNGIGGHAGADAPRTHQLDVVSSVVAGRLVLTWYYAEGVHRDATVRALAEAMRDALAEIIIHCGHSGGRTPSDFPLVRLDQAAVDRLAGDGRGWRTSTRSPRCSPGWSSTAWSTAPPGPTSTRCSCGCPGSPRRTCSGRRGSGWWTVPRRCVPRWPGRGWTSRSRWSGGRSRCR